MSLSLKLSSIRAHYDDAISNGNRDAILDLCASNMRPMLNALDKYNDVLLHFDGQAWADTRMMAACDDFGVEPPTLIKITTPKP